MCQDHLAPKKNGPAHHPLKTFLRRVCAVACMEVGHTTPTMGRLKSSRKKNVLALEAKPPMKRQLPVQGPEAPPLDVHPTMMMMNE